MWSSTPPSIYVPGLCLFCAQAHSLCSHGFSRTTLLVCLLPMTQHSLLTLTGKKTGPRLKPLHRELPPFAWGVHTNTKRNTNKARKLMFWRRRTHPRRSFTVRTRSSGRLCRDLLSSCRNHLQQIPPPRKHERICSLCRAPSVHCQRKHLLVFS